MGNDVMQWRAAIGSFYSTTHSLKQKSMFCWYPLRSGLNMFTDMYGIFMCCIFECILSNKDFLLILLILLLMCGDIEQNPGPESSVSEITPHIGIIHLNIRSIRNKMNFIESFFTDFEVICFSETHLSAEFEVEQLTLERFNLFRRDNTNHSGGLITYVSRE